MWYGGELDRCDRVVFLPAGGALLPPSGEDPSGRCKNGGPTEIQHAPETK